MRRIECARESDAFEAATLGRWPDGCDDELRDHVGTCSICADVIAVTLALQEERRALLRTVPVLPAELAWWRAERRAREEAALAATRPIAVAHAVAVVSAGVGVLALVGSAFGWMRSWLGGPGDLVAAARTAAAALPGVTAFVPWSLPLAIGLGAWLVLAPVALYLSLSDR